MRMFYLTAKPATRTHTFWNGCTLDRACQVWTEGDEARARELAHAKFWQEATPADADKSSPWTDPELVDCAEGEIVPGMPIAVEEAVFGWEDRVIGPGQPAASNDNRTVEDPSKKLDQH